MTSEYAGSMLLELVKDLEAKRCGKKFHSISGCRWNQYSFVA